MMRQLPEAIVWMFLVAAIAQHASGQVKAKADANDAFVDLAGSLLVELPVSFNGPPPEQAREISTGDLVLLQIRYPIVPPMPASVAAASKANHVELVSAATTAREVALLERQPRAGGQIGVGFVQVLVRGTSAGKDQIAVRIKLSDGSVKSVPFVFEVKDRQ
jgi:hypothetical protein